MSRLPRLISTPARALLVLALACTSSSPGGEQDSSSPDDIDTSKIPSDGPALLFPPPLTRRDRRLLPPNLAAADDDPSEPLTVEWPELDDRGRWETSGQTITLRLNHRAKRKGKTPPPLTITPAVEGKARWVSDWSIAFAADAPFDPDTDYTLKLGTIEDEAGGTLEWTGTFRADPHIWIGGKLITYIPEPGKPRVVTTTPYDGSKQGARPEMRVLFDQPVTPAEARDLVTFADEAGTPLPFTAKHPSKDLFDGAKADRRNIVVVRSKKRLRPGAKGGFTVRNHGAPEEKADRTGFEVAPRLRFTKADCRYDSVRCEMKAGRLHMSGNDIGLHFNNTVEGGKALERAVTVDPPVRNLSVWSQRWSSDGQVAISGAFEPSTDYTVTLATAKDEYGSTLAKPVVLAVRTAPRSASVSMPEGLRYLDAASSQALTVTTRNVDGARLRVWNVADTEAAWQDANGRVARREAPTDAPDTTIELTPTPKRDTSVTTHVNLLDHLAPGASYLVELQRTSEAFGAPVPSHPSWSHASKPPLALLMVNDDKAMVVHTRGSADKTLVQVSDMKTGAPVAHAKLFVDGKEVVGTTTDAQGLAVLDQGLEQTRTALLRVEADGARTILPMGHRTQTERHLVPEFAGGTDQAPDAMRGLVMSDRGVYRPGATIHLKGMIRRPDGADLLPVANTSAQLRLIDPTGKTAFEKTLNSDDMGSLSASWTSEPGVPIGRYQVELRAMPSEDVLGRTQVQVAEFEPPRFKVDVKTALGRKGKAQTVEADIVAKYLFGAAMDGAQTSWVVRRSAASMPSGAFTARGLSFRSGMGSSGWSRTGSGTLDASGTLHASAAVQLDPDAGPQSFTLEAEVTDSSYRAIAGRDSVTVHPAPHYAGVKVLDTWPDVGKPLKLELGVIDHDGKPVVGKTITAELVRHTWKRTRAPGPGGSTHVRWHEVETPAGRCTATSARAVVSCDLTPKKSGTYEVRTTVDGHRGGSRRVWAWGSGWSGSEPQPGHRVELLADAKRYEPGDTATVVAQNPFPKATAIFTVEQGSVLSHEAREVEAGPVRFEVPVQAKHAPHAFVTVTLLPRDVVGEELAQWKFGAVKLPVSLKDARLDVAVTADAKAYEPRQRAEIEVAVTRNGSPVAGAEVALAVVDEGVLRLTNYRAPDPTTALRPGTGLHFSIADTRTELAEMLQRSHVAGDGAGEEGNASLVSTRKNFVRTALWRPHLRTDDNGTVKVELELPDNLTEFRMMAVVLDDKGRGGKGKGAFNVRKPLMIQPAVPRFAVQGDRFEAAVMVHNGLESAEDATVTLGDQTQSVSLAANARARVAFELTADQPGPRTLTFEVRDGEGTVRDRVESVIPVQAAGIDERPRLAGNFTGAQEVLLEVPEGVTTDLAKDAFVTVMMGHDVWPELGSRLEYLVDYPHGCVEQTTSSTLPLLAARDILPRLGFYRFTEQEIDARMLAGLKRLASMKTSTGGLAYWPGGTVPNLYGTAYAARAIALAKQQGVEVPGLLQDVTTYLQERLDDSDSTERRDVEQRASIALALAEADALPESAADMLVDTLPHQGPFGAASVALALASLDGHDDQVAKALDAVEKAFDAEGTPTDDDTDDFYYYGSTQRSQAQAALALVRLRPTSPLVPTLVDALVRKTGGYTTQGTAFGLLALREKVVRGAESDARVVARLDGVPLDPETDTIGSANGRFAIPLAQVAGRHAVLRLETTGETPVSFRVSSSWRRPFTAGDTQVETSAQRGPEVYRLYTTPKGEPVDMHKVAPGTVVRVALLARVPEGLEHERRGYLAMTDRLPAGFEAIQPDLWTVSRPSELTEVHPLYDLLQWGSVDASHVELRDDRVQLYFDRFWGEYVAATYTMRATTPGTYVVPPAMAELMYEPDSTGYSKDATVVVTP